MKRRSWLALALSAATLGAAALLTPGSGAATPAAAVFTHWNLRHSCTYCHDPHGGPNPSNLRYADIEVLCLSCHGPGGVSALRAASHEGFTCLVCHDNHRNVTNRTGGENIKLIGRRDPTTLLATIQAPNGARRVTFESLGLQAGQPSLHSFADDDEDNDGVFDGVCEVCHLSISGTPIEADNHNAGQTCTACHRHGDGFEEP